jgi:EAL domain-containing protein (putative c-di-GMP-specific phosphodiesterase class I)
MTDRSALNTILQPGNIATVYQPIVYADDSGFSIDGFECLSRGPKGTNFESAKVLFDYVRLKREESVVDRACIAAALQHVALFPDAMRLSVNVHASTLGRDHTFLPFLRNVAETYAVPYGRLTIEIVEHAPPWDGISFLSALDQLRALGIRIALDDVGLGQSNFKMLLDVCPDYLKLDQHFVTGCARDTKRQAVIHAISELARHFGARIVAEGVDELESVDTLRRFGIDLMQGYLFAQPLPPEEVRRVLQRRGAQPALQPALV